METLIKRVMGAGAADSHSGRPGASQQGRRSRERRPMNPPVSPSRSMASTVHYPPISPSTLPPGQGAAPSPTGSAIGALRRAEEAGARDAATKRAAKGAVNSQRAKKVVVATHSSQPRAAAESSEAAGGVVGVRGDPGTAEEVAAREAAPVPSGVKVADASATVGASTAPVVKKLTVPDVFKQAMKPAVPAQVGGRSGPGGSVVKARWDQAAAAVKAGAGAGAGVGAKQVGKTGTTASSVGASAAPAESGSKGAARPAGGGSQAAGARGDGAAGTVGSKGRARSASISGGVTTDSTDADDKPQKAGPRRLKVTGKGAYRAVSAAKQRAALGLTSDDSSDARRQQRSPKTSSSPPKSADRRGVGGVGVGGNGSPLRKSQPSPKGGGGVAPPGSGVQGGRQSLAAAQKSWGRSGSWYEPRRRDMMSQASVAASAYRSHRGETDGQLKEEEEDSEAEDDREKQAGDEGWVGQSKEESLIDSMLSGVVADGEDTYFSRKAKSVAANAAAANDKRIPAGGGGGEGVWKNRSAKAAAYDAVEIAPGSLIGSSAPSVCSSTGGDSVYRNKGSGKITDKLATFGSAVRLAVSGGGSRADDSRSLRSGRSRSSRRPDSSRGSARSRSRSIAPEYEEAPHSPAGYAHAAEAGRRSGWYAENSDTSAGRGRRRGRRRREESSDGGVGGGVKMGREGWSPASSKRSASSRCGLV